jgi:hypothetical protein
MRRELPQKLLAFRLASRHAEPSRLLTLKRRGLQMFPAFRRIVIQAMIGKQRSQASRLGTLEIGICNNRQ